MEIKPILGQRGGARPGSGRKKKTCAVGAPAPKPAPKAEPVQPEPESYDYGFERARHEKIKADAATLAYRLRCGQLLEKSHVEEVVVRMHQFLAQSLRSLPDNLERRCGLTGEQVQICEDAVDGFCLEIQARLANF